MTEAPTISPDTIETIAAILKDSIVPSTNIAGWTGPKQRRFLEAIADGETVTDACGKVRLSPQSAYAFRRRAKGRAFDLGWKAADLLARERIAADLMVRATEGQEVTIVRADGSTVTRHHYDNRLAVQMLGRLDRYADAAERTAPGHAARMVAGDFDAYLDLVGAEGGPARAGLFMLARNADGETPAAELEPVLALARADRQLRCGTRADDLDVADLDPARRAEWTADQWLRAEAAGVVSLAPPPAPEPAPPPPPPKPAATCKPVSTPRYIEPEDRADPVWWCEHAEEWRTRFPQPEDFFGEEEGDYGDPGYQRQLDDEEIELVEAPDRADTEARRVVHAAERDRWFAACLAEARALAAPEHPAPPPVEGGHGSEDRTSDDG